MVTYGPPFARLPWVMQPGLDWHSVQVYVLNRNQAAVPTAAAAMHDAPEADRGPLTISSSLDEVMPGVHGPIAAHTALVGCHAQQTLLECMSLFGEAAHACNMCTYSFTCMTAFLLILLLHHHCSADVCTTEAVV